MLLKICRFVKDLFFCSYTFGNFWRFKGENFTFLFCLLLCFFTATLGEKHTILNRQCFEQYGSFSKDGKDSNEHHFDICHVMYAIVKMHEPFHIILFGKFLTFWCSIGAIFRHSMHKRTMCSVAFLNSN